MSNKLITTGNLIATEKNETMNEQMLNELRKKGNF